MRIFDTLVHDSHNNRVVAGRERFPDILDIDVSTFIHRIGDRLVTGVLIMPLVRQRRVIECRRACHQMGVLLRDIRICLTIGSTLVLHIILNGLNTTQSGHICNQSINISVGFKCYLIPSVETALVAEFLFSRELGKQRFDGENP